MPNALAPQAALEALSGLVETRFDSIDANGPTTRFASAISHVLAPHDEAPLRILVTAQGPTTALAAVAAPYLGMAYPSATVQAVLFDARYEGQFNSPFSWAFERLVDLSYMFNFTLESAFGTSELQCSTPEEVALEAAQALNATASEDVLLAAAAVPGLHEAEIWGLSSDDDDSEEEADEDNAAATNATTVVPLMEAFSGPSAADSSSPAVTESRSPVSPPDVAAYVATVVENLVKIVNNSVRQMRATSSTLAPPPPPVSFVGLLETLTNSETAATTSSLSSMIRTGETALVQAFDGPSEPAIEANATAALNGPVVEASPAPKSPGAPAAESLSTRDAAALITRLLPPSTESSSKAESELEKITNDPLYLPADLGDIWNDSDNGTSDVLLSGSLETAASTPLRLVLPAYLTPAYASENTLSPSAGDDGTVDGIARLSTEASLDELLDNSPWWDALFAGRDGDGDGQSTSSADDASAPLASASLGSWLTSGRRRLREEVAESTPPSAPFSSPSPASPSSPPPPSSSSSSSAPCSPVLCRARPMLEAACLLFVNSFSGLFPDIPHAQLTSSGTGAAAAVGYDERTETAFVLWKGSQTVADYLQDAIAFLSPLDASWFPQVPGIANAHVHRGFLNQFKSLTVSAPSDSPSANLTAAILSCSNGTVPTRILVAGHSLGSALAELSSVWLSGVFPSASVAAYGTGTPLVGDSQWLRAVRASIGGVRRFTYDLDLVPALPWFDSYARPANGIWIRSGDELVESPVAVASPLYAEKSPAPGSPSPAIEAASFSSSGPSVEDASMDSSPSPAVLDPSAPLTIAETRPQLPYSSLSVADHMCSSTYVPALRSSLALDVPKRIAMMPQSMSS